ncbi:MAG: ChbG/HpnK family deacetylase, partial [Dehalococcoidia bacterium]|nr:ChbG/HpnK family deacetylase [Dehalococcoidia bacterium]
CPALTQADGSFLPLSSILLRIALSPQARQQAWAEMDAQAAEAHRLGVSLDHLDSHHHVHLFGPLLGRAITLAEELRVPLRLPAEPLTAADWLRDREAALASYLATRARRKRRLRQAADHTLGLRLHRTGFDGETLIRVLAAIPEGVTEFICHPGHADDQLSRLSRYVYPRAGELAALTHPRLRSALEEAGVRLTNWKRSSTTME